MAFEKKENPSEATLLRRQRKAKEKAYLDERKANPTKHRTYESGSGKAVDQKTIDDMLALMAKFPDLGLRMMNVRLMIEHRRISVGDIMQVTGRSHEWVLRGIRPSLVHLTHDYSAPNKVTPKVAHERLDELESAITLITEQRGGVYSSCGCSPRAVADLVVEIGHNERDRNAWAE